MALAATALRRWQWLHTWSSLVCTVFLLMLCITGLPLVFHHELEPWLGGLEAHDVHAPEAPRLSLDEAVAAARRARPSDHVHLVFSEAGEDDTLYVGMGATPEAPFSDDVGVFVDWYSGKILAARRFGEGGILDFLLTLHVDMFAGLPGKLFLGAMALLFALALLSGLVLYAPFLRGRRFGAVRRARGPRLAWLDLHNALGAVVLVWALVVGLTGMLNTWADLLLKLWQFDELTTMVERYQDRRPPTALHSLSASVAAAEASAPGYAFAFSAFPGTAFAGKHHYAVFLRGRTPLTSRMLRIALVDAGTGSVTESRGMPWYMTALLLSQPLHFGDYGGLPLKILWAVLDLLTMVVLASGLYLWWRRRRGESASELRARTSSEDKAATRDRWWPAPLVLGLCAAGGLLAALLADGVTDAVSCAALGGVATAGLWLLRPARASA